MWRVILTQQYQYRMKQPICPEARIRDKWGDRACALSSGREGVFPIRQILASDSGSWSWPLRQRPDAH
jgi:hypothetical protein